MWSRDAKHCRVRRNDVTGLVLREVEVEDAYAFRDFMCEPAFWVPLPIEPPTLSSLRAYLAQCVRDRATTPRNAWSLAAVERASGRIVGEGSLRLRPGSPQEAEIGWGVDPTRVGEGFGKAIAAALLQLAFAELRLQRVVARCRPDNAASRAIMAGLGLRDEGLLRADVFARDEWWDSVRGAILARDWQP